MASAAYEANHASTLRVLAAAAQAESARRTAASAAVRSVPNAGADMPAEQKPRPVSAGKSHFEGLFVMLHSHRYAHGFSGDRGPPGQARQRTLLLPRIIGRSEP